MMNLVSIIYLIVFIAAGVLIANAVFHRERPLVRFLFGGVIALAMLLWLPALFSFLSGKFSILSQLFALAVALALGVFSVIRHRPADLFRFEKSELLPAAAAILPLFLFSCFLLSTHTIVNRGGALYVGQCTYGDLAMHLGFITSIAEQQTFPPMYSICPDTPVGYPFLSDSVSSTFYQLGASLRLSTMLPAILALLLVFAGAYALFSAWLKKKKLAIFSTYLFFIGGGFGFWYFFDLAKAEPGKVWAMLEAFYETPTNFVENGLRWVNPIADMLIPQRATLFGWALLLACLYLLYRAVFDGERRLFYPLGVLAGLLPLVHTHSFLALGIISCAYLLIALFRRMPWVELKGFLCYGLIAILIASSQLLFFTFRQSAGFLQLHWNWANVSDSFLWFYIKNWGLIFLLLPAAFFSLEKEDRLTVSGAQLIWVLVETIQFQPNSYDNNKLLFISFLFFCGLITKYLYRLFEAVRCSKILHPAGAYILAGVVFATLFSSGAMTLAREAVSEYELIPKEEVQATDFILKNTKPEATFLTYNNHNNAVAVLTGRNIVCGSGTFLYFHGIDYSAREQALSLMYENPSLYFDSLGERYHVDYVYIGTNERYNFTIDEIYFAERYQLIYNENDVRIYRIKNK